MSDLGSYLNKWSNYAEQVCEMVFFIHIFAEFEFGQGHAVSQSWGWFELKTL